MEPITPDDPLAYSTDIVSDNLAKLRQLFPEAFAEGRLEFDTLRQLVGDLVDDGPEKYGFSWHGKRHARQLALTPSTGTLRPAPEEGVAWDTTQNLMIEGDNLEVLKLLQKSYAGRTKLIYIDPPYNTGKDFVYKDKFKQPIQHYKKATGQEDGGSVLVSNPEISGRFHTNWLNMLYPRLILARELLRPDGFIFVSIDDGEVGRLRMLLDEVFGEDNFINNVIWEKKYTRANDAQFFSDNHDHILVYAKSKDQSRLGLLPRSETQMASYSNPDGHPDGPWKATPLHAKSGSNTADYRFSNGVVWSPPPGTYRRYSDDTMAELEANDEIWFGSVGSATPSRKSFLSRVKTGVTPVTIWTHAEVGHTHEANSELKELVGGGVFDNPKPTRLIQRMLEIATDPDSIVLDFFAGSGTTGHAVMKQNAVDGGSRRFILVQLPTPLNYENKKQDVAAAFCDEIGRPHNIAEVTKERLRRAARMIHQDKAGNQLDLGFRTFRLDTSNIRAWSPDSDDLEGTLADHVEHFVPGRSDQDVLYELLLKHGLDLCAPIATRDIAGTTAYSVGAGGLFAALPETVTPEGAEALAEGLAAWNNELDPAGDSRVVVRDAAFEDDVAKSNFAAILYQRDISVVRSL